MLAAAIPFVESYGASGIGVIVGVHPILACGAAIAGNVISMLVAVNLSHMTRKGLTKGGADAGTSRKRARLKKLFDHYGVAVVSLIGQTVLPSQITSAAMVGLGLPSVASSSGRSYPLLSGESSSPSPQPVCSNCSKQKSAQQ